MDEDTRKDGSINAAFGKHFEQLREQRGMTREQLAESTEVDLAMIEQIEHGEASPSLDTLRQLARGLDLLLSELFEASTTIGSPASHSAPDSRSCESVAAGVENSSPRRAASTSPCSSRSSSSNSRRGSTSSA